MGKKQPEPHVGNIKVGGEPSRCNNQPTLPLNPSPSPGIAINYPLTCPAAEPAASGPPYALSDEE